MLRHRRETRRYAEKRNVNLGISAETEQFQQNTKQIKAGGVL